MMDPPKGPVKPEPRGGCERFSWKAGTDRPFHLEIDTGMGRAGVRWDDRAALSAVAAELRDCAAWEGAYTHFHSADSDPASVDQLFEASQSETDVAKRTEQYARIQEIFNTTGPTIPLYETPYPVALQERVHGFVQIPLGNNIFRSVWLDQ